jgi:hypothetical protein
MDVPHFIWLYLWVAPHLLLPVVAVLMFRRRLHRDFPIFFSYLLFEFLQFCILFTMYSLHAPGSAYVRIDIFGRTGSIALHFGILQEMFEAPVAHSVPLRRAMARTLRWLTAFLVALALLFIGSLYYSILSHRVFQAYVIIEALNIAQCGLLVLVFLWHRFLGLRMSPFVFGIALGMGLVAGFEPLRQALNDSLGAQNPRFVDILQMAIYHCAVLIWLYFAQAREKITWDSKAALPDLREQAAELGRIVHL